MAESANAKPQIQKRVALGVSGGIAAYKAIEVLRGLQKAGCEVRVAMTPKACEFIRPLTFRALSGSHVIVDDYAPDNPDPIAHITFSQTVDLLIVAPATANTIAKFATGVSDDFLTSTYLAARAPVLVAPAMNTTMWRHPATQRNVAQLRADGVTILEPDEGEMACGTIGPGRLSEPERIVEVALNLLKTQPSFTQDLANEHVLITAGATREEIDPVRFISNRSSGRMGFAIAEAAAKRGAKVTVVAGSTTAPPPTGASVVQVSSADQMYQATMERFASASIFIGAAAVADYRPVKRATRKIKKSPDLVTIELEPTADILSEVAKRKQNGLLVVGFAAETDHVVENAFQKLKEKGLDAIVANDVSGSEAGFDSETNAVTIITRSGSQPIEIPLLPKTVIADRILDEVVKLRSKVIAAPHGTN